MADKKEAPAAAKKEKKPEVKMITTKDLADQLGTKPATLRRYLRSLPAFQDGGYTRYKWEPGDKFLKDVAASFEKFRQKEKEKNKERIETMKKEGGKKSANGASKKKTAPKAEEEEEEEEDEGAEELA